MAPAPVWPGRVTKRGLIRYTEWRTKLSDHDLLVELYETEDARVFNIARRVLGDDVGAEEVMAQTFARLAERVERDGADYREPDDWRELLGLFAHGLAIDEYRRRQRDPLPLGHAADMEHLFEHELPLGRPMTLERAEFHVDFDRALRGLPAPERDAFILTELRGLSVRDAADALGGHYRTVARRAEAARTLIRKELSQ